MKSKAGGGIASNKVNNNVAVRGGSPRTEVVSPTSADQLGRSLAYKRERFANWPEARACTTWQRSRLERRQRRTGSRQNNPPCGSQQGLSGQKE